MPPLTCACGDETIPGTLFTASDLAAWHREHDRHGAPEPALTGVSIRFGDVDEAREVERLLRPTHVVGRVGASLFVKPRG